MTTEYNHNIAMLVPEDCWESAGALIACISGQQSDLTQFGNEKFIGGYDACNAQAKASHVQALQAAAAGLFIPERPAWDAEEAIDMVAVLDLIDTMQVVTELPEGGISIYPDTVIIGLNIDAKTLANACGLVSVTSDE